MSVTYWGWVEKVEWWVPKSDRAAIHAARLWSGQEAGVGAGPESHGGRVDGFVGVAVGGDIVEKVVGRGESMVGGVKLGGGELADWGEEGKVQCSRVEKQGPNYLLDPCLLCWRDWSRKSDGGGGGEVERKVFSVGDTGGV